MDLIAVVLLFFWTSAAAGSPDRRRALSYASTVTHTDLRFPDQHAQSSIAFQIGPQTQFHTDHPQQAQNGRTPGGYQGHRTMHMGVEEGQKFVSQGNGQKFEGQGFDGKVQQFEGFGVKGQKFVGQGNGQKFEGQGLDGRGQQFEGFSVEGQKFEGQGNGQRFEGQGLDGRGQQFEGFGVEGLKFEGQANGQKFEGQGFGGRGQQFEGFSVKGQRFEGQANGQKFEGQGFDGRTAGQGYNGKLGQSQSFNVGYSVKFGGPKPKKSRHESDVITGSFKEQVANPFVRTANSDDQLIQQAHLTPKTNSAYLDTFQRPEASPWRSLSPSVEIYKSSEVKKGFDHGRALGKSEGFDYTNAVDFKPFQPQFRHAERVQEVAGSPKGLPRLPIDTSLIRDPVLTTNRQPSMSSKQIPIHFDTSLIRQMSKTGLDQSYIPLQTHLDYNLPAPSNPPQPLPLVQQVQHTQDFNSLQPEQSKNNYQINFSYPQNGLFDPQILTRSSKSKPMYSVSEAVEDNVQPQQTRFKVFGKPQNNFMRHEYEKAKGKAGPRAYSPRRTVRNWDVDLRPPPLVYARRRIYV